MKDIIIKINTKTRMVSLSKSIIGNDGENLQSNFVFEFDGDFINGQARLEYAINNEKKYVFLDRNDEKYITPIKSFLTKEGSIDMQLVILEGTNEENVPIFKSNVFYVYCNRSINADIEEPEISADWFEMANTKLTQADNLNISTIPIQNGVQIDTTSKNGETTSTEVINGKDGYTPVKGIDYFDGKDGTDGKDGYTPIKGVDYFDGKDGTDGIDGKTPVKGVDYFTESEINQIVNEVLNKIPTSEGVDY